MCSKYLPWGVLAVVEVLGVLVVSACIHRGLGTRLGTRPGSTRPGKRGEPLFGIRCRHRTPRTLEYPAPGRYVRRSRSCYLFYYQE